MSTFTLELPLHLIQAVRLVQALAESSHTVQVPPEHLATFRYLAGFFPLEITAASAHTPVLPGLALDHEAPRTSVGRLSRALIFPHALCEHLRDHWADTRPTRFSFSGLPTPKRRERLRRWFLQNQRALGQARAPGVFGRSLARIEARLRGERLLVAEAAGLPGLFLSASRRGRRFPVKAFDPRYYETLCSSRFVLCPDGDFVWTYRFFEACLCGAIPLIERRCVHHEGFKVATLETPIDALEAFEDPEKGRAIREHNFALARERLTLDRDDLDAEIERLLG